MRRRSLEQVGAFIRDFRKDQGLTQKELGELCGIHAIMVQRIERGKSFPNMKAFMAVCEALGLSADRLLWEDAATEQTIRDEVAALRARLDEFERRGCYKLSLGHVIESINERLNELETA